MKYRVGSGFDVHAFEEGRPCILGGVTFSFPKGPKGHSDADVVLHAICDALLGALALGDLGDHFPDTDPKWKGADSKKLIKACYEMVQDQGYELSNLDVTLVCEQPKIKEKRLAMRESIAELLNAELNQISVKATTEEKMGYTGSGQGLKAYATVLVHQTCHTK